MAKIDPCLLPAEAWRPAEPIAGRASNRISERELERIPAWLSMPEKGSRPLKRIPVKLWDYSAFGFAALVGPADSGGIRVQAGDVVWMELMLGSEKVRAECLVQNTSFFRTCLRVGLRRMDLDRPGRGRERSEAAAPEGQYLRLPKAAELKAEIRNSVLYGEWSPLRLLGIRSGLAFEFLSDDGALPLFVGQEIDVNLALPTSDANVYRGRVARLERIGKDTLRIRLEPTFLSAGLANDLAEFLASEGGVSPDILKGLGFPIRFFRKRISCGFVESMDDYEKVMQLRRNAYVEARKKAPETPPEKMSSKWDKLSRILCVFHEDVLVASATMTFPSSDTMALRSEAAFPGARYPCETPAKTDLIEVSGLCTHADYRKGDLLHAVFEHIARVFLFSDRNHILTLADSELLPLYRKIGFRDLKRECDYLGRKHHLIDLDKRAILYGKGMPVLAWNGIYGDLIEDMLSKGFLSLGPAATVLARVKLAFRPVSAKMLGDRMEALFQKHLKKSHVRQGAIA